MGKELPPDPLGEALLREAQARNMVIKQMMDKHHGRPSRKQILWQIQDMIGRLVNGLPIKPKK